VKSTKAVSCFSRVSSVSLPT